MNTNLLSDEIIDWITRELLDGAAPVALTPETNLFLDGGVDSIGIMRLIDWLEKTYIFKVPPKDMVPNHFRTVSAMAAYVASQLSK